MKNQEHAEGNGIDVDVKLVVVYPGILSTLLLDRHLLAMLRWSGTGSDVRFQMTRRNNEEVPQVMERMYVRTIYTYVSQYYKLV